MSVLPIRPRIGSDRLPDVGGLRVPGGEGVPLTRCHLSHDDRDPAPTVGVPDQHFRVRLTVRIAPGGEAVVPNLERFATRDDPAASGSLVGLELVAQHQIVEPWHRVIVSRTRYVQEGGGSIEQALRTESRAALWRRGQSH